MTILLAGLPGPRPAADGFEEPDWNGTRADELLVQRCARCATWRWGPEWLCFACHSFDTERLSVEPCGAVFSWERVWHPVHPALNDAVPYVVVLMELAHAGGVRMVGNLGRRSPAERGHGRPGGVVFEDHDEGGAPYTLVHWVTDRGGHR